MLSGTASELERELPFWVFVDAIDDYLRSLEPRRFDALGDETRSSLAVVFPSLAQFAVPGEAHTTTSATAATAPSVSCSSA